MKPFNTLTAKSKLILKLLSACIVASLFNISNAAASTKGFQVAVVEHTTGAKEIIEGQYETGLKKLSKRDTPAKSSFNRSLTRCAANIMLNDYQSADGACTVAIEKYKNRSSLNYKYFKSIAYSNRGVARYLKGDMTAASDDLKMAASLDDNKIVMANLANIKAKIANH
ncbi:hypothetical protein FLL45_04790 [Aliikangiella marina]|uniref:Tetratricopeptide repeat protein n=1 Tax=Aliikangiella marina TaxID=1712262 RepID=A0A545TJ74_9GAMM|nr:hypothetical protein [Aliikangiella marina]TQV77265.1 hypothetical protein FLL45_04790 [Aliikangiella marina]